MHVHVLGSISVVAAAAQMVPAGRIARRVLAVLAAEANRPVHPDRLTDLVWSDEVQPQGNSLQAHISRWRKVLGAHRITYAPAGYSLQVTAEELDALKFEALVEAATAQRRDGDLARSVELFDEALALWRGEAFGELNEDDCVRARRVELETLRSETRLDRLEALCDVGAYERVVPDAMRLGEDEPWSEPVHRVLARAHYGRGDQVAALQVLTDLEARLRNDLGLDLATSSHLLRGQVLRQEPALDLGAAADNDLRSPSSARMAERIVELSPLTRSVLQAAALAGLVFDTAQVRHALALDGSAMADALSPAFEAGIIVRVDDGVQFSQSHVRDAVAELVPAGETIDLHRRLGESLLLRSAGTDVLVRAARHLAAAAPGDPVTACRAADLDRRLADTAMSQGRSVDAVRHASRAVASAEQSTGGAVDSDGDPTRVDHAGLWLTLAEAQRRAADLDAAMMSYQTAAQTPGAADQVVIHSALAYEQCSLNARRRRSGAHDPSIELLERAARLVGRDDPVRVEVLASLGQALTFSGLTDRASRLADEAVMEARRAGEPGLLARTLLRRLAAHDPVVGGAQRLVLAQEAAELSRSAGADELELEALCAWVPELMRAGQLLEAERVIGRVEQLADVQDNLLHRCKVPMWRAAFALAAGRHDEAEVLIEDFRVAGERDGYDDTPRVHGFQSILLCLGRGDADRAKSVLDGFKHDIAFEPWRAATMAVAHARGDTEAVQSLLVPWSARRFALSQAFAGVQTFCACLVADAVAQAGDEQARARLAALISPAVGQNQVLGSGAAMLGDAAHHVGLLVQADGDDLRAAELFDQAKRHRARWGLDGTWHDDHFAAAAR